MKQGDDLKYPKIIAVDFDGCLATNNWPDIGEPIPETIEALKREQDAGAKVILWTCRRDEQLTAAVEWCAQQDIRLDAVNANLPSIIEAFGGDTVKVFANEYWDDRARLMPTGTDARDSLLLRAINTYGEFAQRDMMVEEMSELTKALCKLNRGGSTADVLEEMADVQIMLDQMKIIFGDTSEAEKTKLDRLASRLREPEGKWIEKEYRKAMRDAGLLKPAPRDTTAIDTFMNGRTKEERCTCGGELRQTRKGSLRARCTACEKVFQLGQKQKRR